MAVKGKSTRYKRAAEQIKLKYGLSVSGFESLWDRSGGRCEICGRELRSTLVGDDVRCGEGISRDDVAVVDHCHETGDVRGILCNACNSALGFFKDSQKSLAAAAAYLAREGDSPRSQRSIGCEEFHAGLGTRAARKFGDRLKAEERKLWARKNGPVLFKYFFERPSNF